ncbi:MAG: lytic murein transglycosylase, partial [Vibrio fluvialis]
MKLRSLLRHQSHSKLYRLTGSFLILLFSAHTTALSLDDAIASQRALLSPYQHQIESRLETYQPLLAHIFNQLDHKKLPQQLALLPMLESSFDPNAISHAGA